MASHAKVYKARTLVRDMAGDLEDLTYALDKIVHDKPFGDYRWLPLARTFADDINHCITNLRTTISEIEAQRQEVNGSD
jgi:hypothetical protein